MIIFHVSGLSFVSHDNLAILSFHSQIQIQAEAHCAHRSEAQKRVERGTLAGATATCLAMTFTDLNAPWKDYAFNI